MKKLLILPLTALAFGASAEIMDRPIGIKIGERMTLKPYLSVSAAYDSNVSSRKSGDDDVVWTMNPGLNLEYRAENWLLVANGYYQYNAYSKSENASEYGYHGFGEDVSYSWSNSKAGEKGWGLRLAEKFVQYNQQSDLALSDGRSYGRDRQEVKLAGSLQRRFTDKFHGELQTSYYLMDYDNDRNGASALYGWDRWLVGLEGGYAFSRHADFLVSASYQGYTQENTRNSYYNSTYGSGLSNDSESWMFQVGLGSYATERITWRALAGWSRFEYANADTSNGFIYSASGHWKIGETWNAMLLATSHYQPSEREYGSSTRVDNISAGIAKVMVRGKVTSSLDLVYRRETHDYTTLRQSAYDVDVITARFGFNYIINRYLTTFLRAEYQKSWNSDGNTDYYDYDRWRATFGFRFTY